MVARDGFCDWFRQVPAAQDFAGELGMRDADVAFFVVGKAARSGLVCLQDTVILTGSPRAISTSPYVL